jgi:predicted site-specific integrase-resolvase
MKQTNQIKWLPEKIAAEMIGYAPKTLRRKAKSGEWEINWAAVQGRRYRYSESDINNLLLSNSTISR